MQLENKKGNANLVIIMLFVLFLLLFIGIGLAFGIMITDWVFDEIMPEITTIGNVGSSNISEYTGYAMTPVNNFVQSFTWLGGVLYVLGLAGCLGLAFAFRFTGNKWLLALFICGMLLLIIACIFISNIYEEFYNGTDEVGTRLKENALLSYMILYSPLVMCTIGFICGIIMFTGEGGEEII